MAYDDRQVTDLIAAVKVTHRLLRRNLEKRKFAAALDLMAQLELQAQALYDSHVADLKQQLLFLEAGAGRPEESGALASAQCGASREPERQGQHAT